MYLKMKWQTIALWLMGIIAVGGIVTYVDLFSGLFELTGITYTHSGDVVCASHCESYINITTTYWRICFASYNNTKYEDEILFKKRSRSRTLHVNLDKVSNIISTNPEVQVDWLVPTYGKKWRPIKDGDCWDRLKTNKIKIIGHKEPEQTVKWGFNVNGYVDIDPKWIGEEVIDSGPITVAIINGTPEIRILNQSYIDKHIEWYFNYTDDEFEIEFEFDNYFYQDWLNCEFDYNCLFNWCFNYLSNYNCDNVINDMNNLSNYPLVSLSDNIEFDEFEFESDDGKGKFKIKFPDGFEEGEVAKFGFGSTTVNTTTSEGSGWHYSWNHRIFYDNNNDRWYILFIQDNGIRVSTSSDGVTWTSGLRIDSGLYRYEDFDAVLDYDGSTTYLHIAYVETLSYDELFYRRIELTNTAPFMIVGGEEIPYDSSEMGLESSDDVSFPKIALDSNDCVIVAFSHEDNSESTYSLTVIKEDLGTGCGDGDFDMADIEDGYPKYSVQNGTGYGTEDFPLGISTYSDSDADDMQLFWLEPLSGSYQHALLTAFMNQSTDDISYSNMLDPDVEAYGGNYGDYHFYSLIVGEKQLTFGLDDGTQDLDVWIINTKNGTLDSQVDTGIGMDDQTYTAGYVTAIIDTQAEGGDDIWVFAVDNADDEDIYYSKSTDGGSTWADQTLWQDEAGKNEVKFLSAYFDENNCNIGVTWLNGSSSPYEVEFDVINTGSCVPADTCSCPASGDWHIDCSDNCVITEDCDMQGNDIHTYGTGTLEVKAEIYNYGLFVINAGCVKIDRWTG